MNIMNDDNYENYEIKHTVYNCIIVIKSQFKRNTRNFNAHHIITEVDRCLCLEFHLECSPRVSL